MPKVQVCETAIRPRLVNVPSTTQGDGTFYTVIPSTIWNDSVCTCKGFQFRGECKHAKALDETRCRYIRPDDGEGPKVCPDCGGPVIKFEIEPEWD